MSLCIFSFVSYWLDGQELARIEVPKPDYLSVAVSFFWVLPLEIASLADHCVVVKAVVLLYFKKVIRSDNI